MPEPKTVQTTPASNGTARTFQERLAAARRQSNSSNNPGTVQSAADNAAATGIEVEAKSSKEPTLAKPEYQALKNEGPILNNPHASESDSPVTSDESQPSPGSSTAKRVFDEGDDLPSVLNAAKPGTAVETATPTSPVIAKPVEQGPSSRKPFTVTAPSARIADRSGDRSSTGTTIGSSLISKPATTPNNSPLLSTRKHHKSRSKQLVRAPSLLAKKPATMYRSKSWRSRCPRCHCHGSRSRIC